jgi:Ran GTPase-activating protein (RanGAP) involved in mRNA processing and transport
MSRNRRWFRLSLRNLFVLFTCVAIAIGLVAYRGQQRKAALAAIRKAGGTIHMAVGEHSRLEDWFGPEAFGSAWRVDLHKSKADKALVAQIAVLKELTNLDLSNADIDDEGVRQIAHLPLREQWLQSTHMTDASAATISRIKTLDFLMLNATGLSDRFLEQLEPLPALEKLGLRGTRVTGAGMKFLARHPNLKELDVYWTKVDDAGVETLSHCQSLTCLGLSMTGITNDVFQHLDKLPSLAELDLTANRTVTKEAVQAFQTKHPLCKIEF